MDESIHIDTGLLREHVSVVRNERRIAEELRSQVEKLRQLGGDAERARYQAILNRIENLVQYYRRMAEALETVGDEAVQLYRELSRQLQSDSDEAQSEISRHLML